MHYFKRYFDFVKPYRWLWIFGILFAIILTGIDLYIPLVLKRFISLFTETPQAREEVLRVIRDMVIVLLIIYIVRAQAAQNSPHLSLIHISEPTRPY